MARPIANQIAAQHELDRRRVQNVAIASLRSRLARLQRLVISTYETGGSIRAAVRAGLDERFISTMTAMMVTGHLEGVKRSKLSVDRHVRARGIQLSTAFDGAISFLRKRLLLTEGDLEDLSAQYESNVLRVTGSLATSIESRVQQAIAVNVEEGGGVREGIKSIRAAFEAEGMAPAANYQLEQMVRTQTQLAYSAGRVNALNDPDLAEIFWGYEYATVRDDRVRDEHAVLDGIRRPKDDPFWSRFMPPNGYNCRCSAIEVFEGEQYAKAAGSTAGLPDPDFDFNPADVFQQVTKIAASRSRAIDFTDLPASIVMRRCCA